MTARPAPIDISDKPELAEFVRELLASGQPRELRRGDEVLGVLSPADAFDPPSPTAMSDADREVGLANAAGIMEGMIDVEAMHRALAESRRLSISRRRYP